MINSETTLWNVEFIGEKNDTTPKPNRSTVAIGTQEFNRHFFNAPHNATFKDWNLCIIFPDSEKTEYFLEHWDVNMHDFREAMLKDDYVFHIVHFHYPKRKKVYADQMYMTKDFEYV